jgi:(p)ppGpp synthase/HD superfamily hydrolase
MTDRRLTERFERALFFAAREHAAQVRKGSDTPYIAHLLGVCAIVLEHEGDEDEAIAALLHDAIEDQGGAVMRERIRREFGDRVTAIVDGCTDAEVIPKPPWRVRKEAYLAHLPGAEASVHLVSAADKLYNARAILEDYRRIGEALWERFTGGREGTLWYYRSLADQFAEVLRQPRARPLAEELSRVVAELERLAARERTARTSAAAG